MGSVSQISRAQSIIKTPGAHASTVELEPHLVLRPFDTPDGDFGLGLGFRAAIPILENGFVPSINNSVSIGFGFDWMNYRACRFANCGSVNHFMIPVVMQWNFWLTKSWSVFGEPGVALNFYSSSYCKNDVKGCYNDRIFAPLVFFAGARWHFSTYTTLTMRIGWPYWSVGVSFL